MTDENPEDAGEDLSMLPSPGIGASVLALENLVRQFSRASRDLAVRDYFEILEQVATMCAWNDSQRHGEMLHDWISF